MKKATIFNFPIALFLFIGMFWMNSCSQNSNQSSSGSAQTKQTQAPISGPIVKDTAKKLALEYQIRESKLKEKGQYPLVLMLHGYGSNEQDLFSFANNINEAVLLVTAQAPFKIGKNKYQWYGLNPGSVGTGYNANQAEKSRQLVLELIDQLCELYPIDKNQIYVGGFSQGAILSLGLGISTPEKIKGVVAFSGRLNQEFKQLAKDGVDYKNLSVYLYHGRQDKRIGYSEALIAKKFLDQYNIKNSLHSYPVGHTISSEGFKSFNDWLTRELK